MVAVLGVTSFASFFSGIMVLHCMMLSNIWKQLWNYNFLFHSYSSSALLSHKTQSQFSYWRYLPKALFPCQSSFKIRLLLPPHPPLRRGGQLSLEKVYLASILFIFHFFPHSLAAAPHFIKVKENGLPRRREGGRAVLWVWMSYSLWTWQTPSSNFAHGYFESCLEVSLLEPPTITSLTWTLSLLQLASPTARFLGDEVHIHCGIWA